MALKQILGIGLFVGDIFLIVWLISLIGLRASAYYTLSYIAFTFISALVLILLFRDYTNEVQWEKEYDRRQITRKKGYYRFFLMITIIVLSMLSIAYLNIPAWFSGSAAAFLIVVIWLFLCGDILYMITNYMCTMEDIILESKLIKRLLKR